MNLRLFFELKNSCTIKILIIGFLCMLAFLVSPLSSAQAAVVYVDGDILIPGDGTTWGMAFDTIQDAIDDTIAGDEIWIKQGTYTLSSQIDLNKAVAMYGGFAGTETQRHTRDWANNKTTIDGNGTAFHCVYVTADANIDGFTITGGQADGSEGPPQSGGGIYNDSSSPTIRNCIIAGNDAEDNGGGIYNNASSPVITNCIISHNSAGIIAAGDGYGGGISNWNFSSPIITNCTITVNSTLWYGGGIMNSESSLTITNSIIWGNTAQAFEQIFSPSAGSYTTINYCDVQGGFTGDAGNIGTIFDDPEFVDADGADNNPDTWADNDYHLTPGPSGSPCIDAGDNDALNLPTEDLDGYPRILDGDWDSTATVDMGAY